MYMWVGCIRNECENQCKRVSVFYKSVFIIMWGKSLYLCKGIREVCGLSLYLLDCYRVHIYLYFSGAVHRYYESRRRLFLDSQPERAEVAEDSAKF